MARRGSGLIESCKEVTLGKCSEGMRAMGVPVTARFRRRAPAQGLRRFSSSRFLSACLCCVLCLICFLLLLGSSPQNPVPGLMFSRANACFQTEIKTPLDMQPLRLELTGYLHKVASKGSFLPPTMETLVLLEAPVLEKKGYNENPGQFLWLHFAL